MNTRKLIRVYTGLLIITVATMILSGLLKSRSKTEVPLRDYPEIQKEGILRLVTECNQSNHDLVNDTTTRIQYNLNQTIARLSGLEVQMFPEVDLDKCVGMLESNECDVIIRNQTTALSLRQSRLWVIRENVPILLDSLNHWLKQIRKDSIFTPQTEKRIPDAVSLHKCD